MNEKKIWDQLKNGDRKALEMIYNSYIQDLFSYGKKFSFDSSLVEDCIQDLFVELWNRRESISSTDQIKPYLFVSLRRKIIRHAEQRKKRDGGDISSHTFDASLSIESILIKEELDLERKEKLKQAFEELSERQKEIIYLKFYAGLDYESISSIMDMKYQSARNLLSRSIAKLAQVISVIILIIFYSMIKIGS